MREFTLVFVKFIYVITYKKINTNDLITQSTVYSHDQVVT